MAKLLQPRNRSTKKISVLKPVRATAKPHSQQPTLVAAWIPAPEISTSSPRSLPVTQALGHILVDDFILIEVVRGSEITKPAFLGFIGA